MQEVVICSALRTAIGSFQGQWARYSSPELAASVIRSIVRQTGIRTVDECILGCVLSAGVGQAPARQALMLSGLPDSIPCTTVNKVCGSAMKAVALAYDSIMAGSAVSVLAGGMESMSNAPYIVRARETIRMGHREMIDHMFYDGLENASDHKLMGYFAEQCAYMNNFSRKQQDCYSITSVERAEFASLHKEFSNEIISLDGITEDEQIKKCDITRIHKLKPAFNHISGTITAANASSISDGAAVLLICDQAYAENHGLTILARIRSHASHAKAPEEFTTAVDGAIRKCLARCGWSIQDVDVFEINEAFAVVVLAAMQSLKLTHDRVNMRGGACAMGHPIGASGARIIATLINIMRDHQLSKGVASVCIGGGEAMAIAIEL